jgi:hypothetical protein
VRRLNRGFPRLSRTPPVCLARPPNLGFRLDRVTGIEPVWPSCESGWKAHGDPGSVAAVRIKTTWGHGDPSRARATFSASRGDLTCRRPALRLVPSLLVSEGSTSGQRSGRDSGAPVLARCNVGHRPS